jgi:RNA polymerase sigma-70 factor (ECF subfamily)
MNVRCIPTSASGHPTADSYATEAPSPPGSCSALLLRTLAGERAAERRLVEALTPTIRASVAYELGLRRGTSGRAADQEVDDITQSVLLGLFTDGGRTLKAWNPARGSALKSFVALLARRRTATILRSRRKSPWVEEPVLLEDLDRNPVEANGPESRAISRDLLAALVHGVRERLSARGAELFQLLYLEGLPNEDVCAQTGLTPAAVYQWKHRLRDLIADVADDLTQSLPQQAPLEE